MLDQSRLGNMLQSLCGPVAWLADSDIPECDDPHKLLVFVDDRETPDLDFAHVSGHVVDILIFKTALYVLGHDVAHGRIRPAAPGNAANGNTPIRNNSDQAIVVSDRQKPDVEHHHRFGDVL